jgi:hypothetical protein
MKQGRALHRSFRIEQAAPVFAARSTRWRIVSANGRDADEPPPGNDKWHLSRHVAWKIRRPVSLASKRRSEMRDNSGGGKSQNNMRDPTVRDHERATGKSGEAIQGEKKAGSEPSRTSAPKHQNS